jgi:peroxin-13
MRYIRAFIARLRGQPAPPEEVEISGNSLPVTELDTPPNPGASKKPLLLFLLSVFGLPYLIGKLIRSVAYYHSQAVSSRHMGQSSALLCRAIFDFVPQNPRSELPLRKGEIITIIAQGSSGWWRGRLQDGREGFVPATYLVSMVNQSQPIFNAGTPGQQTEGQTLTEEFEGK